MNPTRLTTLYRPRRARLPLLALLAMAMPSASWASPGATQCPSPNSVSSTRGTVTLSSNPDWTSAPNTIPIIIHASHSAGWRQRVTITNAEARAPWLKVGTPGVTSCSVGGGKKVPCLQAVSDPDTPQGSFFLNDEIKVPYFDDIAYRFNVKIEYDDGSGWKPSQIKGEGNISVAGKAFYSIALSNDGGNDDDWDDAVVTIAMFNHSKD